MKIVYVIDHLRPDGTQRVLAQLVEGLARRGHEQAVVCLEGSCDPMLVARLRASQASVRRVGRTRVLTGVGLLSTLRWLRRHRCDVLVTLLFVSDVVGRALARAAGVPRIVSSIRARNVHYPRWKRWMVRQTMRWADAVVINAESTRAFAVQEENAPAERTVFIPNGVELGDPVAASSGSGVRAELEIPESAALLGCVGRLTAQKGQDLLLATLSRIPVPRVHLLLIGAGEDERRLRSLAERLRVADRVRFTGHRRDVPRLLSALDLYVHPARFEGTPNAVLEAMAAGCPIVASDVDGIRELLRPGIHGWLTPAGDVSALAVAITEALGDPVEARRRGEAARARAACFTVETMVDAWERVLAGHAGLASAGIPVGG